MLHVCDERKRFYLLNVLLLHLKGQRSASHHQRYRAAFAAKGSSSPRNKFDQYRSCIGPDRPS